MRNNFEIISGKSINSTRWNKIISDGRR